MPVVFQSCVFSASMRGSKKWQNLVGSPHSKSKPFPRTSSWCLPIMGAFNVGMFAGMLASGSSVRSEMSFMNPPVLAGFLL